MNLEENYILEEIQPLKKDDSTNPLIIGVDIDDVLGGCMEAMLNFHNEKYGTTLQYEQACHFDLWKIWGGTEEETYRKIEEFYESIHFETMKPFEDAIEELRKLAEKNTLIAITARPEYTRELTEKWILTYFPNTVKEVFLTNGSISGAKKMKKSEVCISQGISIMIDDSLKNAQDCGENDIKVFLIDRPWNQGYLPRNVERVYSWSEIVAKISSL